MEGELSFKSGKDLAASTVVTPSEVLSCESCGQRVACATAIASGWQLQPPACPDCLRWAVSQVESRFHIEKRGRFWAVLDGETLVCITVYRKGAEAVVARIATGGPKNMRETPNTK